jgi:hypothetical protein
MLLLLLGSFLKNHLKGLNTLENKAGVMLLLSQDGILFLGLRGNLFSFIHNLAFCDLTCCKHLFIFIEPSIPHEV